MLGDYDCWCSCAGATVRNTSIDILHEHGSSPPGEDADMIPITFNVRQEAITVGGCGSRGADSKPDTFSHQESGQNVKEPSSERTSSIEAVTKYTTEQRLMLSMDHLTADLEIMRGIDLMKTLRAFGRMWRKSPVDMQGSELVLLWTASRNTAHFDIFLSHTWWTPGKWKVLALLIRSGLDCASVFFFLSILLILSLYMLGVLPMPFRYSTRDNCKDDEIDANFGPWLVVFRPWAGIFGLVLSP
eukprot:TRINITY_DN22171_c0_g1_i1.p1 TRINITY_DN22171_c0_g1~~TRINITY_DN22171_c0_g1_i1.p1  ORF type:complete len:244 (-),score=20.72 TRINITY_DN22171_c0_g1_i1:67-798(-)